MKTQKGVSAWLILWDSSDKTKVPKDEVAAILNPRLREKYIAKIMELLYANAFYNYDERIGFATRKWNSCPAQFNGWKGEITCGHNPYLEAFIVDDLRTITDENGKEKITFKKRSKPEIRKKCITT
jgi:hypothetical protein